MTGNNIKTDNTGFSLVEMMVAVAVFTVVIVMVTSIFQHSMLVQKNAIATQGTQEGIRYALEVISKEVRSAKSNYNPLTGEIYCIWDPLVPPVNKSFNYNVADSVFYFRNRLDQCVYYYLVDDQLFIEKTTSVAPFTSISILPITPRDVIIDNFFADQIDDAPIGPFPEKQGNVTFVFDIKSKIGNFSAMKIQTSITSRYYE